MKKLLILFFTVVVVCSAAVGQEVRSNSIAVRDTTETALIDSLRARMAELTAKIGAIDSTTSFNDIVHLKTQFVSTYEALQNATSGAPKPNTKDGVSWWADFVMVLWDYLWILITTLITSIFGYLRKDPNKPITAIQKFLSKIKTRYILIGASLVATIIGLAFYKEGAWTWPEAALAFIMALLNGIGLAEVLAWIGIRIKAQPKT